MGDISANFSRSEFACKCGCGQNTIDVGVVNLCQRVRNHFNKPVTITSANRCKAHNKAVGGAESSQHLKSRAADIVVKDVKAEEVYRFLDGIHDGGLGGYDTFTHLDTRNTKTRW